MVLGSIDRLRSTERTGPAGNDGAADGMASATNTGQMLQVLANADAFITRSGDFFLERLVRQAT